MAMKGNRQEDNGLNRYTWRFIARANLFAPQPTAGVWRLSHAADGMVYPFVVARLGLAPGIFDPWFGNPPRK